MRKNTLIAVVLILGVIFMALPAFAGYEETTTFNDQLDHTKFAPDFANIGSLADDNGKPYGPGTIYIPYTGSETTPWDSPGCNPNVEKVGGGAIGTDYNCAVNDAGQALEFNIIQDLFGAVVEGDASKGAGNQGIAQYLDSLFIANVDDLYIDQTLDQDLADLTGGATSLGTAGIWQRLHSAVDIIGMTEEGGGPRSTMGIDQTVEAYMADKEAYPTSGDSGVVVSYMAQWFQGGVNLKCNPSDTATAVTNVVCFHTEFGGHGTVNSTPLSAPKNHDP